MAAARVEEVRAVLLWHAVSDPYVWPESGTRVVVGWWGRRCAREEIASESIGIFVVLRRHKWHTRGHRAATCGPRGALGAIHVWPHTHGEGRTRRARGRSEQRANDSTTRPSPPHAHACEPERRRTHRSPSTPQPTPLPSRPNRTHSTFLPAALYKTPSILTHRSPRTQNPSSGAAPRVGAASPALPYGGGAR